jgi:hypothetical protein
MTWGRSVGRVCSHQALPLARRAGLPDVSWILGKKQLELAEAKYAMQAEALRQVRVEPGSWGEGRL